MKNFVKINRKACIFNVLLLCVLFSCNDTVNIESRRDYMQRVFLEEARIQRYYTQKFLDASDSLNIELMGLYIDSIKMANYCSNRVFKDMYVH